MLNYDDFALFVPASQILGQKLRETREMDIDRDRKRERMRGFCKRQGVNFIKINKDCSKLYTGFQTRNCTAKMDIELKDPGLQIYIAEEDSPR